VLQAERLLLVREVLLQVRRLELADLLGEQLLPAELVDGLPPCGDRQPGPRLGRHAVARPGGGGGGESVLGGVLRELEAPEAAAQGRHPLAPFLAERAPDRRRGHYRSACQAIPVRTGRTSTVARRISGIFAAQSMAVSRSGTSTR